MEEKILEIMKENYYDEIPKLIADHFKEFFEWLMWFADFDSDSKLYSVDMQDPWMTLEEAYRYWLVNIKNK